jgi:hypothetical protein
MIEDYPPDLPYNPPPEPRPLPPWNPVTRRKHYSEVMWQITIPLTVGIVLIAIVVVLTVMAAYSADMGHNADVAFIWLAGIQLMMGLFTLGMLVGVVYGLYRLMEYIPGYSRLTQDFLGNAGVQIRRATDVMVEPFLRGHEAYAGLRALWRRDRHKDS